MIFSTSLKSAVGAAVLCFAVFFSGMAGNAHAAYAAGPITVGGKALITNTDGDPIRVRDGAGTKYNQVAEAHEGETASVLAGPSKDDKGNVWFKVQVPDGTGWVLTDFMAGENNSSPSTAKSPSKTANSMPAGSKAVVTNTGGDAIRVRNGAGVKYDEVAEAHEGETASILAGPSKDDKGNTWYKVQVPGGSGWVLSDFLASKGGSSSTASKPASPTTSSKTSGITAGGKAQITNTDGDNIRVRDGAGAKYSQIAEAHEGETASVLAGPSKDDKGNVWFKVQVPDGAGWVLSDFLVARPGAASTSSSAQTSKPQAAKSGTSASKLTGFARVSNTDGDYLRIRSDPSRKGSVLTTISPDTTLGVKKGPVVDSEKITWYQVTNGGVTGWAMAQYMAQAQAPVKVAAKIQPKSLAPAAAPPAQIKAPAAAAQPAADSRSVVARGEQPATSLKSSNLGFTIVGTAMKYLGSRYVFGGMSPSGFDCSGFVSYVVNRSGGSISRDMYSQASSGTRISSSNLQPGDLLFFSNTYKRGLSHTGIYIGNGRFIHAENESAGVTISEVWSAYWASHYTAAVRLR